MFRQKIHIILFLILIVFYSSAQDSTLTNENHKDIFIDIEGKNNETEGKINIIQDYKVISLVNKHIKNCKSETTIPGWRIQIYYSAGKEAREEASEIRTKFLEKYPDLSAYLVWQPPYIKIRIGDFRSKQDAFAVYKYLFQEYPISYIIPDKINLPKL